MADKPYEVVVVVDSSARSFLVHFDYILVPPFAVVLELELVQLALVLARKTTEPFVLEVKLH